MPRNARASALSKMRDLRARYHNGSVPIEAVGLKLFTGIENFEIMASRFIAGNFLLTAGSRSG